MFGVYCCCYTNLKISLQWSINGRHVSVTLLYTVNWIITELLNMLVSFHIIYPRYWYWICHSTSLILFFECPDYSHLRLLTSFHFWSLSLTDRAKTSAVKNLFCQLCLSQRAKFSDVTSEKCKIIFGDVSTAAIYQTWALSYRCGNRGHLVHFRYSILYFTRC